MKLYYCKLDITIYDSIVKLFEKCERKLCNTKFWQQKIDRPGFDDTVIILMSADGAAHQVSKEGDSNVISLNFQIINSLLLKEKITSTQSHNIMTRMQVIGSEKASLCCTMFEPFLQEIKDFNKEKLPSQYQHLNYMFLHINDAKMFYALLQHSLFNRLGYPYLQCGCKRDSLQKECTMLNDDQYGKAWRKSSNHFKNVLKDRKIKYIKQVSDTLFLDLMQEHRKWCDTR